MKLNAKNTQGKYIALNVVPNQKVTIVSLFNWHHTYKILKTIQSISNWKDYRINKYLVCNVKTTSKETANLLCTGNSIVKAIKEQQVQFIINIKI